jgi:thymidylate synthase (FAD)
MDPHAQLEIRLFAHAIAEIVKAWVPMVWEAFEDYTLNAVRLSAMEMQGLRAVLKPDDLAMIVSASGLKGREAEELRTKMKKIIEG